MTGPTQRCIRVSLIRVNRNKLAIEERVVRDDGERAEMEFGIPTVTNPEFVMALVDALEKPVPLGI